MQTALLVFAGIALIAAVSILVAIILARFR